MTDGALRAAPERRQLGIAEATFDVWRKKFTDLSVRDAQDATARGNTRLKRVVADLTLDKHVLHEVLRKKA